MMSSLWVRVLLHRFFKRPIAARYTGKPIDGQLVFLLHGFPDAWFGWEGQIGPLVASGFRVFVPFTLLKHHPNRHPVPDWVHQQVYLHPYPKEPMLRNHV